MSSLQQSQYNTQRCLMVVVAWFLELRDYKLFVSCPVPLILRMQYYVSLTEERQSLYYKLNWLNLINYYPSSLHLVHLILSRAPFMERLCYKLFSTFGNKG